MKRPFLLVLLGCLGIGLYGCASSSTTAPAKPAGMKTTGKISDAKPYYDEVVHEKTGNFTLTLTLPHYREFPDRKRFAKLTIDGKEIEGPYGTKTTIPLTVEAGKENVELVFSFWPVSWSNTIRKRSVPVKPDGKLELDISAEDPKSPDHVEAIFFQTAESLLEEMMQLAKVTEKDTVMDIGCGDGRLVITAVKNYKAKKGIGIDIRPELVELSQENAKKAGVEDRTEFLVQNALEMKDVSHVSVVFMYLGEDLCAKLQPLLQKTLKPGSRVVSLDFPIGDWKEDVIKPITAKNNYGQLQNFKLRLWVVK